MSKHTPTPWEVNKGGAFNPERWGAIERNWIDPDLAGTEEQWQSETIAEICIAADGIDKADAELIVRLVNQLADVPEPDLFVFREAYDLRAAYGGAWGEYPGWPRNDWRNEVAAGDTTLGYWEWVVDQTDKDDDDA